MYKLSVRTQSPMNFKCLSIDFDNGHYLPSFLHFTIFMVDLALAIAWIANSESTKQQ